MKTKVCKICNQDKPLKDFDKHNRTPDGYSLKCRNCSPQKGRKPLSEEEKSLTGGGRHQPPIKTYGIIKSLPFNYLTFVDGKKAGSVTSGEYTSLSGIYKDTWFKGCLLKGIIPRILQITNYFTEEDIHSKKISWHFTVTQVIQVGNIRFPKHVAGQHYEME